MKNSGLLLEKLFLVGTLLLGAFGFQLSFGQHSIIHHVPRTITIDGHLDEWISFDTIAIKGQARYVNDARYALGWDSDNLFVAFDVGDTQLCVNEEGNDNPRLYFSDAVEVYIDTRSDSGNSMDLNDYQILLSILGHKTIFKGDKRMILDGALVPKDFEGTTMVIQQAFVIKGTINAKEDRDKGYTAELAIPWNALGIVPGQKTKIKLDLCIDDVDTTSNIQSWPVDFHPPSLHYTSFSGQSDFGYPQFWKIYTLSGEPGFIYKTQKAMYGMPPFMGWTLLLLLGVLLYAIVIQYRKIAFLKALPDKSAWASWKESHPNEEETQIKKERHDSLPENETIATIRNYVLTHLGEDISVADLAAHMHKSVRQLQRICKSDTGLSPLQLVTILKLDRAGERLMESSANIAEIAYEHGFSDPSYFANVFKKYHGKTPLEYRKYKI